MALLQDAYFITAVKLIMGFLAMIIQIKLSGKSNLAPSTIVDQLQNYVLGGIIGGVIYNMDIGILQFMNVLLIWTLIVFITKYLTNHNRLVKRFVDGTPVNIIERGVIQVENATQAGMSASDLAFKLRTAGIVDIRQVRRAILEQNGQLTIVEVGERNLSFPLIVDGQVDTAALEAIDQTEEWLDAELAAQGYTVANVYMANYLSGQVVIAPYPKQD